MWTASCPSIVCWKDCSFYIEWFWHSCWKSAGINWNQYELIFILVLRDPFLTSLLRRCFVVMCLTSSCLRNMVIRNNYFQFVLSRKYDISCRSILCDRSIKYLSTTYCQLAKLLICKILCQRVWSRLIPTKRIFGIVFIFDRWFWE